MSHVHTAMAAFGKQKNATRKCTFSIGPIGLHVLQTKGCLPILYKLCRSHTLLSTILCKTIGLLWLGSMQKH